MRPRRWIGGATGAVLACAWLVAAAQGAPAKPPAAKPAGKSAASGTERDVAVTVYNQNLGVVKDRRTFTIAPGASDLEFRDVATLIDPTSVHLRSLGRAPVEVLWQDYRYDLVSTDKLLQRYVDQPIEIATKDDAVKRGTLLSYDPAALVLQDAAGGLSLVSRGEVKQIGLKDLPKGLITRPTLVWRLDGGAGGEQPLEVSYMTGGMDWHAEYVAVTDADGVKLDLQGWASIENRSGATFENARIKLVAGAINRAASPREPVYMDGIRAIAKESMVAERGFFEYHLYEVGPRATVADNEVKQIGLFHATGIKSTKKFTYDGASDGDQVKVRIEFENSAAAGLGMPLPEGVVRVFQRDTDGSLELAGEDRIKHTPKNETVRVAVGSAFDIVPERKQTDFKQVSGRVVEISYEIVLRNHKAGPVDVTVTEHADGQWEILSSSLPFKKKDARTFEFLARCEPEKPVTIAYTVRIRS